MIFQNTVVHNMSIKKLKQIEESPSNLSNIYDKFKDYKAVINLIIDTSFFFLSENTVVNFLLFEENKGILIKESSFH